MDVRKMKKEELELLSTKDITYNILENRKRTMNTADLFTKIMKLLELPESDFDKKIGDYYTSLATDKRFILLDDGTWDLRSRHTSDKVKTINSDEDEDDEDEEDESIKEEQPDEIEEDNYDDTDNDYDDTDDDLKDLVVIDEDELELD